MNARVTAIAILLAFSVFGGRLAKSVCEDECTEWQCVFVFMQGGPNVRLVLGDSCERIYLSTTPNGLAQGVWGMSVQQQDSDNECPCYPDPGKPTKCTGCSWPEEWNTLHFACASCIAT
jgi:hypothetical protein